MASSTIVISPPSTLLLAGVQPFGPIAVPAGAFAARVHLAATILLSLTLTISADISLSQDGGVTWAPAGSHTRVSNGVLPTDKLGVPDTDWWLRVPLSNPDNANRQVKGSVTLSEAVTTFVNVVLES